MSKFHCSLMSLGKDLMSTPAEKRKAGLRIQCLPLAGITRFQPLVRPRHLFIYTEFPGGFRLRCYSTHFCREERERGRKKEDRRERKEGEKWRE